MKLRTGMSASTVAFACVLLVGVSSVGSSSAAGLPVLDVTNLSQNIVTAVESAAHTAKQIEQYRTQLQQYENMLQNTTAPASYIWDQAQSTINGLRNSIDTLNYYKSSLGSMDAYLGKFQDVAYYRASPCFSGGACTTTAMNAVRENQRLASESQKKANDALFRGLDKQQDAMEADARQLQRLQAGAQDASGQMKAIQFSNQLASQQANQLLQIRGLLIAQQNAVATRQQAIADQEARMQVADEQALKGSYVRSSRKAY